MTDPIRVSAAILQDAAGRILLVRKRGTAVFMQPGGKPEAGETAAETAAREVREEIGVQLPPAGLRRVGVFAAPAANEAGRVVEATVFRVAAPIRPADVVIAAEIEEARWFSPAELGDEALAAQIAPLTHLLPTS